MAQKVVCYHFWDVPDYVLLRTAEFRKSPAWSDIRFEINKRADGYCECTGDYGNGEPCGKPVEHVHHHVYTSKPEAVTPAMLEGLCADCHGCRHEKGSVLDNPDCCKWYHRPSRKWLNER